MQIRTRLMAQFGWIKIAAVVAIAAAAVMFAPAARAQVQHDSSVGALRIGAFMPENDNTIKSYGRYDLIGGLDYTFQTNGANERSIVSVDYMQQGHTDQDTGSSNNIRIIPVTIGQQLISGPHEQGVRPYTEYGAGAYFVHLKNPSDPNFGASDTTSTTVLGGYIGAGLELTTQLFVDARYHITAPVKNVDTSGLELTAGVRF